MKYDWEDLKKGLMVMRPILANSKLDIKRFYFTYWVWRGKGKTLTFFQQPILSFLSGKLETELNRVLLKEKKNIDKMLASDPSITKISRVKKIPSEYADVIKFYYE